LNQIKVYENVNLPNGLPLMPLKQKYVVLSPEFYGPEIYGSGLYGPDMYFPDMYSPGFYGPSL